MTPTRRRIKNVVSQMGSQLVTWCVTLLFTAALGRYLGASGLGLLFLGLTYAAFFGVLPLYGLQNLVTREVARAPETAGRYLVSGMAVTAALWLFSFVAIQVSVQALGYSALTRQVILIFSLTMAMQAASFLCSAVYRGLERMGPPAAATVLERVLNMAIGLFLLWRGAGVIAVAWVMFAGAAANALWQLGGLLPHLRGNLRPDMVFSRALVRRSIPFATYWAVWAMYWKVDVILLSKLTDDVVVGWYGAAYRFFETLLFLPNVIAISVMLPLMARLARDSQGAMREAFNKGLSLLLVVGIPICAALLVLAPAILRFIYGRAEFLEAAPALRVLAVGVLVLYVNAALSWALVSLDMERRIMFVPLAALALNVALNLLFIPLWRHTGAAAATVITEAIVGVVYAVMLPRWVFARGSLRIALRASCAALGMVAALLLVGPERLPLPLLTLLGAAVYGVLAIVFQAVPREDLVLLRGALPRRGGASVSPATASGEAEDTPGKETVPALTSARSP